jgi:hypothetical protein
MVHVQQQILALAPLDTQVHGVNIQYVTEKQAMYHQYAQVMEHVQLQKHVPVLQVFLIHIVLT